jgi:hypothetical protein
MVEKDPVKTSFEKGAQTQTFLQGFGWVPTPEKIHADAHNFRWNRDELMARIKLEISII